MSLSFKLSACALTVTLAMAPVMSQAWEKDKTYQITILHTNDHHGHFWHNDHGEYGLAAQKTVVDNIRDEVAKNGGIVLLLSLSLSFPFFFSPCFFLSFFIFLYFLLFFSFLFSLH